MFVERLTEEQVEGFIEEHLKEDFSPDFAAYQVTLGKELCGEPAVEAHYCNKQGLAGQTILLDDQLTPFVSRKMQKAWVQHLYNIFGAEYRTWYRREKEKLFE